MDADEVMGMSNWNEGQITPKRIDPVAKIVDFFGGTKVFVGADEPYPLPGRTTTLPESSAARKSFPIAEGVLKYFPAAIAAVAQVSKIGNDKHNGADTPLQHSRGKSMDHADCILRHLVDLFEDRGHGVGYDEQGMPQAGYIAWRALALAQEWLEQNEGAPLAPNAKVV